MPSEIIEPLLGRVIATGDNVVPGFGGTYVIANIHPFPNEYLNGNHIGDSFKVKDTNLFSRGALLELSVAPGGGMHTATFVRSDEDLIEQSQGSSQTADSVPSTNERSRISDMGILGIGYDVIDMQAKEPIAKFTYEKPDQVFVWNGQEIVIPDQIIFTPSPRGNWNTSNFTDKITTARQYQTKIKALVGLEATDPETDLTFKGAANFANDLFTQSSQKYSLEMYEAYYDFVFLQMNSIRLKGCIMPSVNTEAVNCRLDVDKITRFYNTYGTHVVTQLDVGGQMHIQTRLRVDAESSKKINEQNINISAQVKLEDKDHVKGDLGFSNRDENTNELFREVSKKEVWLMGGDITAPDADTWRKTLANSSIPTQKLSALNQYVIGHRFICNLSDQENQMLYPINLKYTEIYEVLDINEEQKTVFKQALKSYLNGINPFKETPQRLKPDMDDSNPVKEKQKITFEMRGWMATYETYAGLHAKPGARAIVRCKSDAEPGGWTEKIIYAGEHIKLREKTPYFSRYMHVEVVKIFDDDEAVVFAENRLVSW